MLKAIFVLSQILGLVSCGALLWLAARVKKRSTGWSLGILLLSPFTAVYYALQHWEKVRKPFLLYISSLCLSLVFGLYAFSAWGGWGVVRSAKRVNDGIHAQDLTEQDALGFARNQLDFLENAGAAEGDEQKLALMRKMLDKFEEGMPEGAHEELMRDFEAVAAGGEVASAEAPASAAATQAASGDAPAAAAEPPEPADPADLAEGAAPGADAVPAALAERVGETDARPVTEAATGGEGADTAAAEGSPTEEADAQPTALPGPPAGTHAQLLERARSLIGKDVLLTLPSGRVVELRIADVQEDRLVVVRRLGGGSFTSEYTADEVMALEPLNP